MTQSVNITWTMSYFILTHFSFRDDDVCRANNKQGRGQDVHDLWDSLLYVSEVFCWRGTVYNNVTPRIGRAVDPNAITHTTYTRPEVTAWAVNHIVDIFHPRQQGPDDRVGPTQPRWASWVLWLLTGQILSKCKFTLTCHCKVKAQGIYKLMNVKICNGLSCINLFKS